MEEWRPVPGHPLLEASSLGRVRSIPYIVPQPNGGERIRQMAPTHGVVSRAHKGSSHRYRKVLFRRVNYKVHKLVCLAFHGPPPAPKGYGVLHGDEDGLNNLPGNLSWGTQKENLNAPGFLAYCRSRRGDYNPYRIGKTRQQDESSL